MGETYSFDERTTKRIKNVVLESERNSDFVDSKTTKVGERRARRFVEVQSTATGGGKYWGSLIKPLSGDIDPDTDLSTDDVGEPHTNDGVWVLILNLPEVGQSTHSLPLPSVWPCDFVRFQDDGATMVVAVCGWSSILCVEE